MQQCEPTEQLACTLPVTVLYIPHSSRLYCASVLCTTTPDEHRELCPCNQHAKHSAAAFK
jgi:hypothetical protein